MSEAFAFEISDVEADEMGSMVNDSVEETYLVSEVLEDLADLDNSLNELKEIQKECARENWEGMDELPITKETIEKARDLLFKAASFSKVVPLPSLAPTSSGCIEMEWYKKRGHRFVIRLNGEGVYIYSGLFGIEKTESGKEIQKEAHGTDILKEEAIPDEIKSRLAELYNLKVV